MLLQGAICVKEDRVMGEGALRKELVETDVLCIGGGIARLMAAIRARELGEKTIVTENGNTLDRG